MTEDVRSRKSQQSGVATVLLRNAFYRDNYRRSVFLLILVVAINIVLAATIVHKTLNPPSPEYFATNSQFQLVKWHPLSDPVVNNNTVLQWVTDAVKQAFSLDFVHWRAQLTRASQNFTPTGWHWFLNAFKQSGDLTSLVQLKLVSNAVVTGSPVIQYQTVLDGRYVWKIQLPMMITYSNEAKHITQPLLVTVIVERVPVQDNPSQIAISQFLPQVQPQ